MSMTEDPRQDALRRAEKRGAARGLRRMQARRRRTERVRRFDLVSAPVFLAAAAAVYLLVASQIGLGPALVVTGLLCGAFATVRGSLNRPEVGLTLGSLVATYALIIVVLLPIGGVVIAAYLLPLAAAAGPFMLSRHPGSRGVTVILGHLGCLGAAAVMVWQPAVGGAFGLVWVLATLMLRGGTLVSLRLLAARLRSHLVVQHGLRRGLRHRQASKGDSAKFDDEFVEQGAAAELQTAARLLQLDDEWTVLHSRELVGSRADVDHLALGLPGVFVIDSKDWDGAITQEMVADDVEDEPYMELRLDGRIDRLVERLQPVVFEARRVAWGLAMPPEDVHIVVCFTDRMSMPQPHVEAQFQDVWDGVDHTVWNPTVHLVTMDHLVGWLLSHPAVTWRRRSRLGRLLDRVRGRDQQIADRMVNERYVRDLGRLADYAFPPKT